MSGTLVAPAIEPYLLSIPIDDVERGDDRRYRIQIDGKPHVVVYHVELDCWFLLEPPANEENGHQLGAPVWRIGPGQWHRGSHATFSARPRLPVHKQHTVALPGAPYSPEARALPRAIHQIWIGEEGVLPPLAQCMYLNARRSTGYTVFLHAHATTAAGWQRLQAQFPPQSGVQLLNLTQAPHFETFLQSALGKFYQIFIGEEHRNYGAASDILRVYLLHREGGIYMDVDDWLSRSLAEDTTLLAGPDDVLVNRMLALAQFQFLGYNNSNFASHAGNRVLTEMLLEMERRLSADASFFLKPRPWRRTQPENKTGSLEIDDEMLAYILNIFKLTGPSLFNDVLRSTRPDYYAIQAALMQGYKTLSVSAPEPLIIAENYLSRMDAARDFYLPFVTPAFEVMLGCAHSWNPVRAASPGA